MGIDVTSSLTQGIAGSSLSISTSPILVPAGSLNRPSTTVIVPDNARNLEAGPVDLATGLLDALSVDLPGSPQGHSNTSL